VKKLLTDAGVIDEDTPDNFNIQGGEAFFNDTSVVLPKPQNTVTLCGDGGASGNGGRLYQKNTRIVETTGDGSIGMFAQSVGGGGTGKNATRGGLFPGFSLDPAVGGKGGAAGDGGTSGLPCGSEGRKGQGVVGHRWRTLPAGPAVDRQAAGQKTATWQRAHLLFGHEPFRSVPYIKEPILREFSGRPINLPIPLCLP
tara:strand:+ start:3220 stop:3813 length:594 start_codon:yes stop_codon:yes gene_type:complete